MNYEALVIGIITFCMYCTTLPPGISTGDSAELALSVYYFGLPHPTGFPTYMILAKLWTLLFPFGMFIWRLTLLSAVFASLTVAVLYLILRKLGFGKIISAASCLSFAFGYRFWYLTSSVHPYFLSLLLIALTFYFLLLFTESNYYKYIYALAIVMALGLGTHLLFVFSFPLAIVYLFGKRKFFWNKKILLPLFVCIALIIILYSYIPLRAFANPVLGWNHPTNFSQVLDYVRQKDYSYKIASLNFNDIINRYIIISHTLVNELRAAGFALILLGIIISLKKYRKILLAGFLVTFFNLIVVVLYGNDSDLPIIYRYLLPIFFFSSIFLAIALDKIYRVFQKTAPLFILLPLALALLNFSDNNMRKTTIIDDTAKNILQSAEGNSIILTQGDLISVPLWYYQNIYGLAKDAIIIDVNLVPVSWYAKDLVKKYPEVIPEEIVDTDYTKRLETLTKSLVNKKFYVFGNVKSDNQMRIIPYGLLNKPIEVSADIDIEKIKNFNNDFWSRHTIQIQEKNWGIVDPFINEIIHTYSKTLNNLGVFYAKNYLTNEAVSAMKKSLEYNPKNKTALENLKNYYLSIGDAPTADYYQKQLENTK